MADPDDLERRLPESLRAIADATPAAQGGAPLLAARTVVRARRSPGRVAASLTAIAAALLLIAVVVFWRGDPTTTTAATAALSSSSAVVPSLPFASSSTEPSASATSVAPTVDSYPTSGQVFEVASGPGWDVARYHLDGPEVGTFCTRFTVQGVVVDRCSGTIDSVGLPVDPSLPPSAAVLLVMSLRNEVTGGYVSAARAGGIGRNDLAVYDDPALGGAHLLLGVVLVDPGTTQGDLTMQTPTGDQTGVVDLDGTIPDGAVWPSGSGYPVGWYSLAQPLTMGEILEIGQYFGDDGLACVEARRHSTPPHTDYHRCSISVGPEVVDATLLSTTASSLMDPLAIVGGDVTAWSCEFPDGSPCGSGGIASGSSFNLVWGYGPISVEESGVRVDHVVFVLQRLDGETIRHDVSVPPPGG